MIKKTGTCFAIMGYGVKTDYATGRLLDLDKTYKNIIKPAAEAVGLECKRADEIRHSGIIDVPMFNSLINADVVIADLSTNNSNAFYELGVRHALRPYTTIAISENKLKKPFDVDHTVIRQYEHLGKDIGYDETMRFRKELIDSIEYILSKPEIDSPVYTYLSGLKPPVYKCDADPLKLSRKDTLSTIIEAATNAMNGNNFDTAIALYKEAYDIDNNSEYIIQKLALSTYKNKHPNHVVALREAIKILKPLDPDSSTDPETLGLSGAIYKRLWEEENIIDSLDKSIYYYEKGFYIKNDYYNGINLAFLLNIRGSLQSGYESIADYVLANRVRAKVVDICDNLMKTDFENRSDQYWIAATLEEALFALGNPRYEGAKTISESLIKAGWERESTIKQIDKLKEYLAKSPLK
jgi:tetratricopeptide (TPR) repeat protein